jgi:hypothetical protein
MRNVIWKVGKQKICVLLDINGKVHQLDLDKEKHDSIIYFINQLYDGIIKVNKEVLPIKIPKIK